MSFWGEMPSGFYNLISNFARNFKDDVKKEKRDMSIEVCGRGWIGCSNECEEIREE